MHHRPVPLLPQPRQQFPYPTLGHSALLRSLFLGDMPLACLVQYLQAISFLLVHKYRFLLVHPANLPDSNRNFLLCLHNRNFSLCGYKGHCQPLTPFDRITMLAGWVQARGGGKNNMKTGRDGMTVWKQASYLGMIGLMALFVGSAWAQNETRASSGQNANE